MCTTGIVAIKQACTEMRFKMQNEQNDIVDNEIISLFNKRSEHAITKTSDKYKNLCFKQAKSPNLRMTIKYATQKCLQTER